MRDRTVRVIGVATAIAIVSVASASLQGQAGKSGSATATAGARSWKPARTPDGQPDIQGAWTFATVTPLERPGDLGDKEFLTNEEAAAIEERSVAASDADRRDNRGTDRDVSLAYNQFWYDRGTKVVGTRRTSLIIDPPDGRLPPLTPEAQKRAGGGGARGADSWESRNLWERCLTQGGLPRLPTGYNNNLQIVQTPGYVVILYEMIHEARVIPLSTSPHVAANIRQYLGDSRGHWEGDTLVVDVTNFTHKTSIRGSTDRLHLIERFTRVGDDALNYEFTVDDPSTFTKPWTAMIPMPKLDGDIYEYACHEGNVGMAGVLAGAREDEKKAAEAVKGRAQ